MSVAPNPYQLLTDQQFAILFAQAATPVITQAVVVQGAIQAMSNQELSADVVNQELLVFSAAYQALAPYFAELARRAAPPVAAPV